MRRIDIITIGIGIFAAGGLIYLLLQFAGIDSLNAGIWSQAILVGGLLAWLFTYIFRVLTHNMTYNQQIRSYEEAVIEKRLAEMSPEELSQLQAEIEQEKKEERDS